MDSLDVFFEMNGEMRQVTVDDNKASVENISRPKADASDSSQVGAPMAGVLVELRIKEGSEVKKGDPLAVLSAMKMVSFQYRMNLLWPDLLTRHRKWSSLRRTTARFPASKLRRVTLLMALTWSARLPRPEWAKCSMSWSTRRKRLNMINDQMSRE